MSITLLPRPSVLTSLVVAGSVASGLAFGVMAAGALLLAARMAKA